MSSTANNTGILSKEEILENVSDERRDCFQFGNNLDLFDGQASTVFEAMSQYAQQQERVTAIAFAEWTQDNRWYTYENGKWRYTFEHGTAMRKESYEKNYVKTTEQLYNLFLQDTNE